jgi:hypothetical protein
MRHPSPLFSSLIIGLLTVFLMTQPCQADPESDDQWLSFQKTIERHLGRPYVFGTAGLKSFDCSGFVWRIMADNGIMIKRTTARKLYLCLPGMERDSCYRAGALVFFDNLKHVGIVRDQGSFYHAQVSKGTNLSAFEPYWRDKIYGFKKIPLSR